MKEIPKMEKLPLRCQCHKNAKLCTTVRARGFVQITYRVQRSNSRTLWTVGTFWSRKKMRFLQRN